METYSNWEDVPAHLKTKTGLKKLGLRPKRDQQPVAVKTHWRWKIPDYDLYDQNEAEAYTVSDAQKQALEKARAASLAKRTCKGCGYEQELGQHYKHKVYVTDGYCPRCHRDLACEADRLAAIDWAKAILDAVADGVIEAWEVLILDSETTDLYGEIIELGVIDLTGNEIYHSRFKPVLAIAPGAQRVHGISADDLAECPDFAGEYPKIRDLLEGAGKVLIYNAPYDVGCLQITCDKHGVERFDFNAECLMAWYAMYVNNWSHYYRDYKYPALGGDHSAVGDCRAALSVLREMAGRE